MNTIERLERLLSLPNRVFSPPIFVHERHSDGGVKRLLSKRQEEGGGGENEGFLTIECSSLLITTRIYGRIAERLFKLSRVEAMQVDSLHSFMQLCRQRQDCTNLSVLLTDCDVLLKDDPTLLWALLHFSQVLPDKPVPLRIILQSSLPHTDFGSLFLGSGIDVFNNFSPQRSATLVGIETGSSSCHALKWFIDLLLERPTPEGISYTAYKGIVQNVYAVAKDQIDSVDTLQSYVAKILPVYLEKSQTHKSKVYLPGGKAFNLSVALEDTSRLYQTCLKQIGSLVNGESLRFLYSLQIRQISLCEAFVLLAAFIAGNNPSKFDLRLFSSVGKRARVSRKNRDKLPKAAEKNLRIVPKAFPLERLLAITYFIVPSPVPSIQRVYAAINSLIEQRLLYRITMLSRLDNPKFRCVIPIDFAMMLAGVFIFDLGGVRGTLIHAAQARDLGVGDKGLGESTWMETLCCQAGFLSGMILTFFILLASVYRRLVLPSLARKLPPKRRPQPITLEVLREVFDLDDRRLGSVLGESAVWLNHLASWAHEQLAEGLLVQESLKRILSEAAVDIRRKWPGLFLCDSKLENFYFGGSIPQISCLRIVNDPLRKDTLHGDDGQLPVTIAADISYRGGLGGTVRFDTILGIPVWIQASLCELEGTAYFMISPTSYHLTFRQLSRLRIRSRTSVAGREWSLLNWLTETWLLPARLKKRFLAPGVKSRWLFDGPPKPYYPWDPEVRADASLLFAETVATDPEKVYNT